LPERISSLLESGRSIVDDLTESVFVDSSIVGVRLEAKQPAAERSADTAACSERRRARPSGGCSS
jgi:hypothetical protein